MITRWTRQSPSPTIPTIRHSTGYSRLQIALHWGIVLLLIVQFLTGDAMSAFFDHMIEADGAAEGGTIGGGALVHVVFGVTILTLAVMRRMSGARSLSLVTAY